MKSNVELIGDLGGKPCWTWISGWSRFSFEIRLSATLSTTRASNRSSWLKVYQISVSFLSQQSQQSPSNFMVWISKLRNIYCTTFETGNCLWMRNETSFKSTQNNGDFKFQTLLQNHNSTRFSPSMKTTSEKEFLDNFRLWRHERVFLPIFPRLELWRSLASCEPFRIQLLELFSHRSTFWMPAIEQRI